MRYEKHFIDELSEKMDWLSIYSSSLPDLKKRGKNYISRCPFHEEKSGSFYIYNNWSYHCFGCGAGGDGIQFVMAKNGMSFLDAIQYMSRISGFELPKESPKLQTKEEKIKSIKYAKACSALEAAQSMFEKNLVNNKAANDYLLSRGVTQESIDRFGIGFAINDFDAISKMKYGKVDEEGKLEAGLISLSDKYKKPFDRFRNRVMFPIYGYKDRLIGYGARSIDESTPKYLNSPETILFKKGEQLYGMKQAIDAIKVKKRVFVVEGYIDVVMLSQYGICNVVASLGTSVTNAQIKSLFSQVEHITFCFDGDKPGRKAAWKAATTLIDFLDDAHKVDFMFMPDGLDPDDFVRAKGSTEFELLANSSRTLTDFLLDVFMRFTNVKNSESLAKFLLRSNELAEKIKNGLIRISFQKRIAELAEISLDTMLLLLKEEKQKLLNKQTTNQPSSNEQSLLEQSYKEKVHSKEISVAAKLLAICILKDHTLSTKLDTNYLQNFLSANDRDLLFPIIAYIRSNSNSKNLDILVSFEFNPLISLIKSLIESASLLGEGFNPTQEAKSVIDGFKKLERVWQIVKEARKS